MVRTTNKAVGCLAEPDPAMPDKLLVVCFRECAHLQFRELEELFESNFGLAKDSAQRTCTYWSIMTWDDSTSSIRMSKHDMAAFGWPTGEALLDKYPLYFAWFDLRQFGHGDLGKLERSMNGDLSGSDYIPIWFINRNR